MEAIKCCFLNWISYFQSWTPNQMLKPCSVQWVLCVRCECSNSACILSMYAILIQILSSSFCLCTLGIGALANSNGCDLSLCPAGVVHLWPEGSWAGLLFTALYLGICLAVKRSPYAAHNYKTASLGSLTPSFISQSHLTIFTLQTWATESRWCSLKSLHRTQTATINRPDITKLTWANSTVSIPFPSLDGSCERCALKRFFKC